MTVVGLKIVGIVSIENETIDTPLVIRTHLLLLDSFSENVVEGVIQRLVGFFDDGSPIRNYRKSERQIPLNKNSVTVGIST